MNVYPRFTKNFSKVAGSLNEPLKNDAPEKLPLDEEQIKAFGALIDTVTSAPVIALPVKGLQCSVDSGALAYALGCTFFQTHPDADLKQIGFWSRSLSKQERSYSTSESKWLGVIWAFKKILPYLLYESFIVQSDQISLKWLVDAEEQSERLMNWRLHLHNYEFHVMYKFGSQNTQGDALLRLATNSETVHDGWGHIPAFFLAEHEVEDLSVPPVSQRNRFKKTHDDLQSCAFKKNQESVEDVFGLSNEHAEDLFATVHNPLATDPEFIPISHKRLVTLQLCDPLCMQILCSLNWGWCLPFGSTTMVYCFVVSYEQIVMPNSLKAPVLHSQDY